MGAEKAQTVPAAQADGSPSVELPRGEPTTTAAKVMERLFQYLSLNQSATPAMAAPTQVAAQEWNGSGFEHQSVKGAAQAMKNDAAFVQSMDTMAQVQAAETPAANKVAPVDMVADAVVSGSGREAQTHLFEAVQKQVQGRDNTPGKGENRILSEALTGFSESRQEGVAAPEKAEEPPRPRTLPQYVTRQVGRGLARAVNQGESSLTLQLKPANLGRMIMKIDNAGDSMKVSIMTEHHSAKEILTTHSAELKQVMAGSGISLDNFEVEMSSDFKQSMADAQAQSNAFQQKKGKGQQGQGALSGTDSVEEPTLPSGNSRTGNAGYHLVV